jgi:putative transposase
VAKHRKVYRFRMKPSRAQAEALARMAGARRFVWNWALARRREHYEATRKSLRKKALMGELTALKRTDGLEWLNEADSQALQQAVHDLDRAFVNFFEKRARFPRFKSRKRDKARFRIPQRVVLSDGKVYVPKVGWVSVRQTQEVTEPTKSATFRRAANGKWYVSLVAEFEMPEVALPAPDPAKVIGIDLGLTAFATFFEGPDPIPAPRFYRKAQRRLARAQRHLCRCRKGSNRREKAKARVARIHTQVANRRREFLHQLTTGLVAAHDGLCIEDLNVRALARTKLSKSFTDAAHGEWRRQVEYKTLWNRKHLAVVDRFFASSRRCSECGALNETLALSDRQWVCACAVVHDRDQNAAKNIKQEGLRILLEEPRPRDTGRAKRSGRPGKTSHCGALVDEPRIPRL